jgi:hypothetical protein
MFESVTRQFQHDNWRAEVRISFPPEIILKLVCRCVRSVVGTIPNVAC